MSYMENLASIVMPMLEVGGTALVSPADVDELLEMLTPLVAPKVINVSLSRFADDSVSTYFLDLGDPE